MATKAPQRAKGSKKTRKYGRAKTRHQAHIRYTNEKRYLKNQKRDLVKHLLANPNDQRAQSFLTLISK